MKSWILKTITLTLGLIFSITTYAIQPVTIVVPFAPGSNSDIIARTIQKILINDYKIETTVEYKLGAGGDVALTYVANYKEPHTVIVSTPNNISLRNAVQRDHYNLSTDLIPLAYLGEAPQMLVAGAHLNINSVAQLQALPKDISYASAGVGSASQLNLALLAKTFKQPGVHIPYKGASAIIPDLAAGRTDIAYNFGPTIKNLIDNGQIVPLAVAGEKRLSEFPNVPTLNELGLKKYYTQLWIVTLANSTADKETLKIIQQAIQSIADNPTKRSEFEKTTGLVMDKKKLFKARETIDEATKGYQKIIKDLELNLN